MASISDIISRSGTYEGTHSTISSVRGTEESPT